VSLFEKLVGRNASEMQSGSGTSTSTMWKTSRDTFTRRKESKRSAGRYGTRYEVQVCESF